MAFALLSALVVGLTVDRVVGREALDAEFLPTLFKSSTLPASSLGHLANGRDDEAIAEARAAVFKQPLTVDALAALAKASAVVNPEMSSIALTQAAALGWRNVVIQTAVINGAASTKSWSIVAPRLLAMTKLNKLDNVSPAIFANADVEEYALQIAPAFSASGSAWFQFVKWLGGNGMTRERDGLLKQTPLYDREADCVALGLTANELARDGNISIAADLIDSRCRRYITSPESFIGIDQHFGDVRRGPFEWRIVSNSGVTFSVAAVDGKTHLDVVNSDPLPRKVASRMIRTASLEKSVKLLFTRLGTGNLPMEPLPVFTQCLEGEHSLRSPRVLVRSGVKMDCPFTRIVFQVPTGAFRIESD